MCIPQGRWPAERLQRLFHRPVRRPLPLAAGPSTPPSRLPALHRPHAQPCMIAAGLLSLCQYEVPPCSRNDRQQRRMQRR